MREADKEIRERDKWQTKPVRCPDGNTRLITMPEWYWNSLDWLCEHGGCERDDILSRVMRITREHNADDDVELQFQANLQGWIGEAMTVRFPLLNVGHPHNDNGDGRAA